METHRLSKLSFIGLASTGAGATPEETKRNHAAQAAGVVGVAGATVGAGASQATGMIQRGIAKSKIKSSRTAAKDSIAELRKMRTSPNYKGILNAQENLKSARLKHTAGVGLKNAYSTGGGIRALKTAGKFAVPLALGTYGLARLSQS